MKKDKDKDKKKKRDRRGEDPVVEKPSETASLEDYPDPLADLNSVLGGKWKARILWALRERSCIRYGQLKGQIAGITDMMLSQSLRELTAHGLVVRHQFQEIPPRVEYEITPKGAELLPALGLLAQWLLKNCESEPLEK